MPSNVKNNTFPTISFRKVNLPNDTKFAVMFAENVITVKHLASLSTDLHKQNSTVEKGPITERNSKK